LALRIEFRETAAGLREKAQLPSTLAMEGTQVALNILLRAENQKKKQIQVTEKEQPDSNDPEPEKYSIFKIIVYIIYSSIYTRATCSINIHKLKSNSLHFVL